jgi:hypothetical protein
MVILNLHQIEYTLQFISVLHIQHLHVSTCLEAVGADQYTVPASLRPS